MNPDNLPLPVLTVTAPPLYDKRRKLPNLEKRRRALESVRARFAGKPLVWGKSDCVILARAMAAAMGHAKLPKVPKYRNPAGALKALKEMGHDNLITLLDAHFQRIVPAAMLQGDLALVESEIAGFGGTVAISLGAKLWGWHPDVNEFAVVQPHEDAVLMAWRL